MQDELRAIRALLVQEEDTAAARGVRTVDLVREVVRVAHRAQAGLRESMIGESGAVELALTAQEVTDLVLSGVAFTEVGGGDGVDVLVKLVDTTGWLRQMRAVIRQREATKALQGPEGQRGQQQPDRRERRRGELEEDPGGPPSWIEEDEDGVES